MKLNARRVRSTVGALAAAGLLMGAMTGCAPGSDSSGGGEENTTVTWWLWDSNPDARAMVAAFEKENPSIKVEQKNYCNSDNLNANRPVRTTNAGPEVTQVAPAGMRENYGPLPLDLTDYAEGERERKKLW